MSKPRTTISRILSVMADGEWRTVNVIKKLLQERFSITVTDKGLTAQLRDIRKKPEYVVKSNKIKEGKRGTWEYQVLDACNETPEQTINSGPIPDGPIPMDGFYGKGIADLNVDLDVETNDDDLIV